MRPVSVLINRVKCGLELTEEEYSFLSDYLDRKKNHQNIFWLSVLFVVALFLLLV